MSNLLALRRNDPDFLNDLTQYRKTIKKIIIQGIKANKVKIGFVSCGFKAE